jgi:hypothetical protein
VGVVEPRDGGEDLFEQGVEQLRSLLGAAWEVGPVTMGTPEPANLPGSLRDVRSHQVIQVRNTSGGAYSQVLIEPAESASPLEIKKSVGPRLALMRELTGDAAIVVVASWLSPRTRQVLDDLDYSYLDLTGNVNINLPRLGIVIRTGGALRSPTPSRPPWQQRLRGEKAGRLVRVLVDVAPPYRGGPLAEASGLSLGYVSRLLEAMAEQGLIRRRNREVVGVDWPALLRERATSYTLLKAHPPATMIAPQGVQTLLRRMSENLGTRVAATGSVAAAAVAPLAVGGQLMIHVDDDTDEGIGRVRRELGLLPAATGSEVLLLRSAGSTAFLGRRHVDGVPHVALSQLVLDCLGGTGRMPAEGEAVLKYMIDTEGQWRRRGLQEWASDRG